MKYLKSKNIKRRFLYKKYEKKRLGLLFLLQQEKLPISIKLRIAHRLDSLPKDSSISRISNRCVLTNRGRAIDRKYKISRIKMREFMSQGILPGFKRAIW